jgi:hypothetical protein
MQNLNQLLARGEGADNKEDILFAMYQHVPNANSKNTRVKRRTTIMTISMAWSTQSTE